MKDKDNDLSTDNSFRFETESF